VVGWPSFGVSWDRIDPETVTVQLANEDSALSFFVTAPATMQNSASIQLWLGSESINVFDGTIDSVRYSAGACNLTLINKFAKLADRTVGSVTTPAAYTASAYNPHDLAWYLMTSHGGLSAIQSTSNPDINWSAFTSWTQTFSADPMALSANLTGDRAIDLIERVGRLTESATFIEGGKLKFVRFAGALPASSVTLDNDNCIGGDVLLDRRAMVNRYYVAAGYNVASDSFAAAVVAANSASINSYGARDSNQYDKAIWHVTTASAQKLANAVIARRGDVRGSLQIRTPLATAFVGIGDTVTYIDSATNISSDYRVIRDYINMEDGTKELWVY
jgi:hypothetical protein